MVASAQALSLPIAGVLAVGAVIAGVAGGSSSGNSAESAKKALDDKLDAIKLRLKNDSVWLEERISTFKFSALCLFLAAFAVTHLKLNYSNTISQT